MQGFQAFFDPIVAQFGWSRGATAAGMSLHRTGRGLISPFVGQLLDRFGPRPMMLLGMLITGAGFILLGRVQELWQYYAAIALLTLGISSGTGIVGFATTGNWFVRKRGRAMAIMSSASAIGGMGVPLLVLLIDSVGWRDALLVVGIGFWALGLPAALLMRRRPEEHGMVPDGEESPAPQRARGEDPGGEGRGSEPELTVREVVGTRFFWQLSIAISFAQLTTAANVLHIPALVSFGISRELAALAVLGIAVSSFVGRLAVGSMGDYVDKRYLMAAAFASMVLATLAMVSINAELGIPSWLGLWGFSVFFGLGFGGSIPVRLAMIADSFGRRRYGSILGLISAISAGFSAAGPAFAGVMFDVTGSFRVAFLILAGLLALAVPMMLSLIHPQRFAERIRHQQGLS